MKYLRNIAGSTFAVELPAVKSNLWGNKKGMIENPSPICYASLRGNWLLSFIRKEEIERAIKTGWN